MREKADFHFMPLKKGSFVLNGLFKRGGAFYIYVISNFESDYYMNNKVELVEWTSEEGKLSIPWDWARVTN